MAAISTARKTSTTLTNMYTKTYSELITIPSFKERFEYLKIGGQVGEFTFGSHRYLNQVFYNSPEWKRFRRDIILRDMACDLGVEGYSYEYGLLVHHINPITIEDIAMRSSLILDPENVITTISRTHKAIHYGCYDFMDDFSLTRTQNDTAPWR